MVYSGSQLDYARRYIEANPRTGLVTLMIGANDLFLLLDSCQTSANANCVVDGLPALLGTLTKNLSTIYSTLKDAGFGGDLVVVTYYSLDYSGRVRRRCQHAINGVLADVTKSFGGKVAPGFEEFKAAASAFGGDSCAAGLLIRTTATTCDVHPSPAGAALLADAVRHAA